MTCIHRSRIHLTLSF